MKLCRYNNGDQWYIECDCGGAWFDATYCGGCGEFPEAILRQRAFLQGMADL